MIKRWFWESAGSSDKGLKAPFFSVLIAASVREIDAHNGAWMEADGLLYTGGMSRLFDGQLEASTADRVQFQCYLSEAGIKPWLQFSIPWSLVTHVDIYGASSGTSTTIYFFLKNSNCDTIENALLAHGHLIKQKITTSYFLLWLL